MWRNFSFIVKKKCKILTLFFTDGVSSRKGFNHNNKIIRKKNAEVIFTYRKNDISVKSLINFSKNYNHKILGYKVNNLSDKSLKILLKKIKKKHKKINFLINNIGNAIRRTKFNKSSDELWLESLEINLMSAVRITKCVLNLFANYQLSSIVNIGSIAGKTFGQGDSLHYGVAKSALHGFTVGLSKELKKTRVNCVAPNAVNTDFQKRNSSAQRIKNIINKNKSGRLATSEEVASLVMYLCSNKAEFIDGQIIFMTGGIK